MKKIFIFVCLLCFSCKQKTNHEDIVATISEKPSLVELRVENEVINISGSIELKDVEKDKLKIECKVNPKDAVLSFSPKLKNNYWILEKEGVQELVIRVEKDSFSSTYSIKAKRIVKPKEEAPTLIDEINVLGGRLLGKTQSMSDSDIASILKGKKDVVWEVKGGSFDIMVSSEKEEWSYSSINDKSIERASILGYKSAIFDTIKLGEVDSIKEIKIKVVKDDKESLASFKVKRIAGTVDVPIDQLYINDIGIIDKDSVYVKLQNASWPEFEGTEPSQLIVECNKNVAKTIKIDGKDLEIKHQKEEDYQVWFSEIEIKDITKEGKKIAIEVAPIDTENYHTVNWFFKIKNNKALSCFPKEKVTIFKINEMGGSNKPFPQEFIQHLTDSSIPKHSIVGKIAEIQIGFTDFNIVNKIKEISFKVGEENTVKKTVENTGMGQYISKFILELLDTSYHKINITIIPKEMFSPLTYSFELKSDGTLLHMPLTFLINNEPKENDSHTIVQSDSASICVVAKKDVMKEVRIGIVGEEELCPIETIPEGNAWQASKLVKLIGQDGEVTEKDIVIRINPLNENIYEPSICTYHITGTKTKDSNAEFVYVSNHPKIFQQPEWVNEALKENAQSYDSGIKAVSVEIYTVSPKASVRYQFITPEGKNLEGYCEQLLQNDSGKHTANITLLENLPTRIRFFVVAEDGSKNSNKGQYDFTYNITQVRWSYRKSSRSNQYNNIAYNFISVNTKDEGFSGIVSVIFAPPKEVLAYSIKNDCLPEWQGEFEKLKKKNGVDDIIGGNFQWYRTVVDVEKLIEKTQSDEDRFIIMPLMKTVKGIPIECFKYKIKIKVEK